MGTARRSIPSAVLHRKRKFLRNRRLPKAGVCASPADGATTPLTGLEPRPLSLAHLPKISGFARLRPYTLTSICSVEYIKRVESVFEIIAEPNRRAILSLLVSSQQSLGEIERQLRMPQPTVSKHLRVLRDAGFVESTVDAQRRLYRLKPGPFQEVDAWLAQFRRFWSTHLDALERHLDRMEQAEPKKRNSTKRPRNPKRSYD